MPDFKAQFRNSGYKYAHVYMGGTTVGCGDHPTAKPAHRWGKMREFRTGKRIIRDQMCLNCGLTRDFRPRDANPQSNQEGEI